ncbi:MAG: HlyD family efflux transporter periplasmic adaptor subunit [Candidatus Poribacteria bacterium]|nr:HlyD family efflux transporter periplasmic adaptor subunit [Candidatus Poribacteria bacterium]
MKKRIEIASRNRWVILTVIAVLILGFGGLLLRGKFTQQEEASDAAAAGIKTTTVERGDIAVTIDATGTIRPLKIVEVSSKASGKILELVVEEGDYVNEGDVIARIETTYVAIDVEQANADLRAANARLQQAEINIQLQKEQSEIQIKQAGEKLAETQKQLEQITEQIRIEKQANQRQVADAKNSLDMAKLRYKLLTSETVRKEDIKRAEANVSQAKASLELAKKEYDRKQKLFENKYISESDLDATETQLASAQAQYDSAVEQALMVIRPAIEEELALSKAEIKRAEFALAAAKEQIEKEKYRDMEIEIQERRVEQAKESLKLALANQAQIALKKKDLESAKAQVKRSESQLQLAQESLEDTVIRAPISGTILDKKVEEGQVIISRLSSLSSSEGQTLVTMADLAKVYVVTEVDETDIGKVRIGQSVTITVEAYPDQPLQGEVHRIAPQGQVIQNVTTFEVITEIKNTRSSGRGRWGGGGFSGRGDRGGFRRGDGAGEFTPEQRERFRQMRRQRQDDEPSTEDTAASRARLDKPDTENAEDPWLAMMGGFFGSEEEQSFEDRETEEADTPFLKPGMNANVEISAANKQDVLLIANEAILSFGNRKLVRVIGEDGQPGRPQPIVTGISSFDKTEIISGLEEGQVVAIGGFQRGGRGGPDFRRMMQSPAATMRRMQGGFGGRGRR